MISCRVAPQQLSTMAASTPVRSFPILQKNRVALFASAASVMVCSSTAGRAEAPAFFAPACLSDGMRHSRYTERRCQPQTGQSGLDCGPQTHSRQAHKHSQMSVNKACRCWPNPNMQNAKCYPARARLEFRQETVLTSKAYLISRPAAWQRWVRQSDPASNCSCKQHQASQDKGPV